MNDAIELLANLQGLQEPAQVVSEDELPEVFAHNGNSCDCKGCDSS